MPMNTTFDSRSPKLVAQRRGRRRAPARGSPRSTGCGSVRPGRSRRTGTPCRSRPATRCTPCCAAGSASAPTRRWCHRRPATTSFGSGPHRMRSRRPGQQLREQRLGDLLANRRRQVGHLPRVGDQPPVVLVRELFGPKRRQAQLRDGGRAARRVEVGQMPRRHAARGASKTNSWP